MTIPILNELPESFDASVYDSIPYSAQTLFDESSPELENLGREAIRLALEKKLGKPVVSRSVLNKRFGLRNLGFTSDDLLKGKVLVR